jgi:hypothetical protein
VTQAECVAFFGAAGAECGKYPERPEAQRQ